MLINLKLKTLFIVALIAMVGCNGPEKELAKTPQEPSQITQNYIVANADKLETSGKAQVKVLAYMKNDFKDKAELETSLNQLYEAYRHEDGFSNFKEPTVVAVYLFQSEKLAKTDPSAWIAMLTKSPGSEKPYLSYNDFKIDAALELKDDVVSRDEAELTKIKKLLAARHLDMCDLNQTINVMELNCIHQADRLYPDYGQQHDVYASGLLSASLKKLRQKYDLSKKDLDQVSTLALVYCK